MEIIGHGWDVNDLKFVRTYLRKKAFCSTVG
jgi:hypothetical protein